MISSAVTQLDNLQIRSNAPGVGLGTHSSLQATPATVSRRIEFRDSPADSIRQAGTVILDQLALLESNQKATDNEIEIRFYNQSITMHEMMNAWKSLSARNFGTLYGIIQSLVGQHHMQSICNECTSNDLDETIDRLGIYANHVNNEFGGLKSAVQSVSDRENDLREGAISEITGIKASINKLADDFKKDGMMREERVLNRVLESDSYAERNFARYDDLDRFESRISHNMKSSGDLKQVMGIADAHHSQIARLEDDNRRLFGICAERDREVRLLQDKMVEQNVRLQSIESQISYARDTLARSWHGAAPLPQSTNVLDFMSYTILSRLDRLEIDSRHAPLHSGVHQAPDQRLAPSIPQVLPQRNKRKNNSTKVAPVNPSERRPGERPNKVDNKQQIKGSKRDQPDRPQPPAAQKKTRENMDEKRHVPKKAREQKVQLDRMRERSKSSRRGQARSGGPIKNSQRHPDLKKSHPILYPVGNKFGRFMYYVVAVDPKRHASKQRATKSDKTSGENREAEVDHPKKSEGPLKSDPPPSKRPTKTDGGGVAGQTAETGPSAAVRQPPRAMDQPPKAGQTNQPPKEAEIKNGNLSPISYETKFPSAEKMEIERKPSAAAQDKAAETPRPSIQRVSDFAKKSPEILAEKPPPLKDSLKEAEPDVLPTRSHDTAALADELLLQLRSEEGNSKAWDRIFDIIPIGKSVEQDAVKADYVCGECDWRDPVTTGKAWKLHLGKEHDGISPNGSSHTYFCVPKTLFEKIREIWVRDAYFRKQGTIKPWMNPKERYYPFFEERGSDVVRGAEPDPADF